METCGIELLKDLTMLTGEELIKELQLNGVS